MSESKGCSNCSGVNSDFESGDISVTSISYGNVCRIVFKCVFCGRFKEITEEVNQVSFWDFMELIKTNNSEDDKNASR